jgi:hypothetical protein
MLRTDLIDATMEGWARLNAAQRQRFFEAFVKAALRLDPLALRAWLRRRLQNPPLAAPIDPARLIFGECRHCPHPKAGRAKRLAKLPTSRTGTRPMATRRQTLPPVFSAWVAIRSRDPACEPSALA